MNWRMRFLGEEISDKLFILSLLPDNVSSRSPTYLFKENKSPHFFKNDYSNNTTLMATQ